MRSDKKFFTPLLLLVLSSIAVRLFFLHPTFSDESFYFNVAKNIAEGKIPYKDFFFAHPPLQVYALATLYKIFGVSFFVGKLLTLISSSLCIVLLYLIVRQFYKEKSAFLASILFIISPPFLAFSSISYGMWECMVFFLLSLLLLLKKRNFLSAIFFATSVFFRYVTVFYLPLFLILLYLRNEKISRFILYFSLLISLSVILVLGLFGTNYISQTVLYQSSKVPAQSQNQYFSMNIFFIFLATTSALIGYFEKNKLMITFSLLPLLIDVLLLLSLKETFYHYFLLSIPFYLIAFSKVFEMRYTFLRLTVVAILAISLILNFSTLDFYLNPAHAEKFYYMANFIEKNTEKSDTIFGEPVATNYVSFVAGREVAGNYLDSYIQHLVFEGTEKVVGNLSREKPRVIIEMENYYTGMKDFQKFISENYILTKEIGGIPKYLIFRYKI